MEIDNDDTRRDLDAARLAEGLDESVMHEDDPAFMQLLAVENAVGSQQIRFAAGIGGELGAHGGGQGKHDLGDKGETKGPTAGASRKHSPGQAILHGSSAFAAESTNKTGYPQR